VVRGADVRLDQRSTKTARCVCEASKTAEPTDRLRCVGASHTIIQMDAPVRPLWIRLRSVRRDLRGAHTRGRSLSAARRYRPAGLRTKRSRHRRLHSLRPNHRQLFGSCENFRRSHHEGTARRAAKLRAHNRSESWSSGGALHRGSTSDLSNADSPRNAVTGRSSSDESASSSPDGLPNCATTRSAS